MKQLDLIRTLTGEHSVVFVRHGGDHDCSGGAQGARFRRPCPVGEPSVGNVI